MSGFAKRVREWYNNGVIPWANKKIVANAAKKNKIMADENAELTGEAYSNACSTSQCTA